MTNVLAPSFRRLLLGICICSYACVAPARFGTASASPTPAAPTEEVAQTRELEELLRSRPRLTEAVERASDYRFQVLLGVPSPDGRGWERREGFRVDAEYFYPASAIKPFPALAALETLTELRGSANRRADEGALDTRATFVSERRRGSVSIGMLVNGALIVSDNDASDDLFDLAGFDGIHERAWRMGLSSLRVRHRMGSSTTPARVSPRIELFPAGDVQRRAPTVIAAREGTLPLGRNEEDGIRVGTSYFADGRLVEEPMSFEEKNRVSLVDLQDLMIAVMRPDLRPADKRPNLGDAERSAIVDALSTWPRTWGMSPAAEVEHKPLLAGLERVLPRKALRVASKSGRAYGFLVDNAHVVDSATGRSFFLTVALYVNRNGRLNDDTYEYDAFGYPLLGELGEVIARSVFVPPT